LCFCTIVPIAPSIIMMRRRSSSASHARPSVTPRTKRGGAPADALDDGTGGGAAAPDDGGCGGAAGTDILLGRARGE
jgi:hypothetical protein